MSADNNLKKRKVADFVKDGMETEDIRKMVQEIFGKNTSSRRVFEPAKSM